MSGALGLSVEEMNQLVVRFQTAAGDLSSARGNVTQHLGATYWQGSDGDAARDVWDSQMTPRVMALEARLAELVQQLRIQIDQQVDASRADTVYAGSTLVSKDGGGLGYAPPKKKKKPWYKRGFLGDLIGGVGEVLKFGVDVVKTTIQTVTSNPLSLIGAFANPVGFLGTMVASTLVKDLGITGIAATLLTTGVGIVAGALGNASSLSGFAHEVATEVTKTVPKMLTTEALAEVGVPRQVTSFVMDAAKSDRVKFNWDEISYKGDLEVNDQKLGAYDFHVSPSGLFKELSGETDPPSAPATGSFSYSSVAASGGNANAGFSLWAKPQEVVHQYAEGLLTKGTSNLDKGVGKVTSVLDNLGIDSTPVKEVAATISNRATELGHAVVGQVDDLFSGSER